MKSRRSYRSEDLSMEVLEHYRQFTADMIVRFEKLGDELGEQITPIFIALDDEIERRKAKGSAMDRIRQYARTAA